MSRSLQRQLKGFNAPGRFGVAEINGGLKFTENANIALF